MLRWCFYVVKNPNPFAVPLASVHWLREIRKKSGELWRCSRFSRGFASSPGSFPWRFWWAKNTGFGCIRMCGLLVGSNQRSSWDCWKENWYTTDFWWKKVFLLVQQLFRQSASRGTWNDRVMTWPKRNLNKSPEIARHQNDCTLTKIALVLWGLQTWHVRVSLGLKHVACFQFDDGCCWAHGVGSCTEWKSRLMVFCNIQFFFSGKLSSF